MKSLPFATGQNNFLLNSLHKLTAPLSESNIQHRRQCEKTHAQRIT